MRTLIMHALALGAVGASTALGGGGETVVTFENGNEGFSLNGPGVGDSCDWTKNSGVAGRRR